ncbi:MAG: lysophospholipid acyltransferase family protein [Jaaginema sp. PMC 1079.18]|nr:lysophospholipid acyltransferase family protein [Jaaginema sp. PMC 1080.18]MEC4851932.1 lysophospholipid acyltransferase family protein [Jaaginema sp. PMC 1079.18]MEC4866324.1 lysophospholipid acyltransferase family protein [Jaaginema sp. PMC 1078.18]
MTKNSTKSQLDGFSLEARDIEFINSMMPFWDWLYRYYFRVKTDGWQYIPGSGKMLIVGSHNGGISAPDMHMAMYDWFRRFGPERLVYGLAHANLWKVMPIVGQLAAKCGAIRANPEMAIAALDRDAAVLVYPGGIQDVFRPYSQRDRIHFAGRKGFIKLALREETPIIPLISKGAHQTLMVLTDIYPYLEQLHKAGMPWLLNIDPEVFPLYLGLPWGMGFGPLPNLPLPITIHIRVCAPIVFEKYGIDASHDDDYVDVCYEKVRSTMQQELDSLMAES